MVVNLILLVDVCIIMVKQQWQTLFVDYYVSEVKSSLFHHTLKSTQAGNSEKTMRSSRSNCTFQQYLTVTGIKLSSSLTNKKEL